MSNDQYIVSKEDIDSFAGLDKTHFLNQNAKRNNKSLGDLTGLNAIGVHLVTIDPGYESTESHVHYHEEECVYILEGSATAIIGKQEYPVKAGDFIGYRSGGEAHALVNNSDSPLTCLVMGQRLAHDVADYPALKKRMFRNQGLAWNLVDIEHIAEPQAGAKK